MEDPNDILTPKGLNMVHINIRSILNKLNQLVTLFHGFDVIVVSETWLHLSIPDASIAIPGYNLYRQDRNHNIGKWVAGLCFYIKYLHEIEELNPLFNVSTSDHEKLGIKIKHPHIKPFNVIAIYRPPPGEPKKCLDHLNLFLPDLINAKAENYILGDFNYISTILQKT